MHSQRRSAWLWWLAAALTKLLVMAAAATADPALHNARRARAACNWASKLFEVEDHVDAARYVAGTERMNVQLFGI